jgi:hypothetical protein
VLHVRVTIADISGGELMAGRHQTSNGNTRESWNMFLAPALAMSALNPFLAATLKGNAQAQEGLRTVASEWQGFLAHRLQEDIALMQRLTQCTPDQIFAAYADYCNKAAADYGKELTSLTKLMTGVTSKLVANSQAATNAATADQWHWQRAAA